MSSVSQLEGVNTSGGGGMPELEEEDDGLEKDPDGAEEDVARLVEG